MLSLDIGMVDPWDYKNNINHGFIQEVYDYHMQHPAFVRRPMTSFAIDFVHRILDVSYANAFIAVNFGLLFLCGMALFYLAKAFKQRDRNAYLAVVFFYLSFSILFAFGIPIYSYDEPFQYLFLLLTLLCAMKRWWIGFSVSFFLALFARETSVLLIPGFVFFLMPNKKHAFTDIVFVRSVFAMLLATGAYLGAIYWFSVHSDYGTVAWEYMSDERFRHWMFNFQDGAHTLESLVSFFVVLGLPLAMLRAFSRHFHLKKQVQRLLFAFVLSVIINTTFVFWAAKAQEARLFALPLILVWPILGKVCFLLWKLFIKEIRHIVRQWKHKKDRYDFLSKLCLCLMAIFFAAVCSFGVYEPINGAAFAFGYQIYLFTVFVVIVIYQVFSPTKK
ncbi:hypothetical protein H6758_01855 [Candidatus Nomurabacteria bacterium]|nr:hypothetical protein [Candidatus Nomurabacteria bacterium]